MLKKGLINISIILASLLLFTSCDSAGVNENADIFAKYVQFSLNKFFGAEPDSLKNRIYYSFYDASKHVKFVRRINVNNTGIDKLPSDIAKFSKLEGLEVAFNKLGAMPEEVTKLENLAFLDLSHNKIEKLPEPIFNMVSLKVLKLNSNKIDTIPDSMGYLEDLEELYLNDNKIEYLPDSFKRLKHLKRLSIASNKLRSIPNVLSNLKNLEYLDLSNLYIEKIDVEKKNIISQLPNTVIIW